MRLYNLANKTQSQLEAWDQNPDDFDPFQVYSGEKYTTFLARLIGRTKFDDDQMQFGQIKCQQCEDFAECKDLLGEQNALAEAHNQVSRNFD